MLSFPMWFVDRFLPDLAVTYRWHRIWKGQISEIQAGKGKEGGLGKASIFETLLESDLPIHDKSVERLVQDAQTLVGAGSITTSINLALATYYIVEDKEVLEKLMTELEEAMPDPRKPLPFVDLEKLGYLTAVVFKTLRISYGVSHRLQRVCPDQDIMYHDIVIPAGTPVSMTSVHIHEDPSIFPDPRSFRPERWLTLETEGQRLQKYLVAFSRGSRQCLGMHLGSAELYMGLAELFRKFGRRLRVVDTVFERDVELTHDIFRSSAKPESKGICVMIDKV